VSGQRRAPWLPGLIVALLGAVWLCVQVVGRVVQLVADRLRAWGVVKIDRGCPRRPTSTRPRAW
jgi:hypothetical protein